MRLLKKLCKKDPQPLKKKKSWILWCTTQSTYFYFSRMHVKYRISHSKVPLKNIAVVSQYKEIWSRKKTFGLCKSRDKLFISLADHFMII
jgi:hypothetical protein